MQRKAKSAYTDQGTWKNIFENYMKKSEASKNYDNVYIRERNNSPADNRLRNRTPQLPPFIRHHPHNNASRVNFAEGGEKFRETMVTKRGIRQLPFKSALITELQNSKKRMNRVALSLRRKNTCCLTHH